MARTKQVLLRLTEEEYARLKELAGREPMSAYLRRMALGEDVEVKTLKPFDVEVTADNVEVVERLAQMADPRPTRWFCSTCNKLTAVPRCPSNPSHKVTPA